MKKKKLLNAIKSTLKRDFCRFSVSIDNILREICLVEVVGSTLIICLLEYYCITVMRKKFLTIKRIVQSLNILFSHSHIIFLSLNIDI